MRRTRIGPGADMAAREHTVSSVWPVCRVRGSNRPFARSGHMVRNKLHWNTNYAVGLSKQRKVGLDCYEFVCSESPTA